MPERKVREYTHVKQFETEILEMKESGKTHREIAEHFRFRDKNVVKEFVKRYNRVQQQMQAGIAPRLRGSHQKEIYHLKKKKTTRSNG